MPYSTPMNPGEWEKAYPGGGSPNRYAGRNPSAMRRQMAQAAILQGTSTAPVQHWAQGLARMGQALLGGYMMHKADKDDGEREAAKGEAWAKALEAFGRGDTAEAQKILAGAPDSAELNARLTMSGMERQQREKDRAEQRQWQLEDREWQKANRQGPQPPHLVPMQSPETGEVIWFDPKTGQPVNRTKIGEGNALRPWGPPQQPPMPQPQAGPPGMPPGMPAPPPSMAPPQGGPAMPPPAMAPQGPPQGAGMPPQIDPAVVREALRQRQMTRQMGDVNESAPPPGGLPGMGQQPTPGGMPMGGPMGMSLDAPRPPPMQAQQAQAPAPQPQPQGPQPLMNPRTKQMMPTGAGDGTIWGIRPGGDPRNQADWVPMRPPGEEGYIEQQRKLGEARRKAEMGSRLPPALQKAEAEDIEAINAARNTQADLAGFKALIEDGKLPLGVFDNSLGWARTQVGMSTPADRERNAFKASLETLRNNSLRLNSGVQTEGDAIRAWNELMTNMNDQANVLRQIERIAALNQRAAQQKLGLINQRREAQNVTPYIPPEMREAPPAAAVPPTPPAAPAAPQQPPRRLRFNQQTGRIEE